MHDPGVRVTPSRDQRTGKGSCEIGVSSDVLIAPVFVDHDQRHPARRVIVRSTHPHVFRLVGARGHDVHAPDASLISLRELVHEAVGALRIWTRVEIPKNYPRTVA